MADLAPITAEVTKHKIWFLSPIIYLFLQITYKQKQVLVAC